MKKIWNKIGQVGDWLEGKFCWCMEKLPAPVAALVFMLSLTIIGVLFAPLVFCAGFLVTLPIFGPLWLFGPAVGVPWMIVVVFGLTWLMIWRIKKHS